MLFDRDTIAARLAALAAESDIYLGTSSWRYPGWCGILYDEDRYIWQNHFSKKRFHETCLEEYATVFKTVEVDGTYYDFPKVSELEAMAAQVPDDFRFSYKVPRTITIKNFPNLRSFGDLAGKPNDYFLSAGAFQMALLRHLESIRPRVGALIFEFSHFHPDDFAHGREFVAALDRFFEEVPTDEGWQYAVEIRNKAFLHPDYFAVLAKHGVAHVYNQWTLMPSVAEQIETHPPAPEPFVVSRYLLTPHRSFDFAQREFEPYNQLKEIDGPARQSLRFLVESLTDTSKPNPSFLYVANNLEGNALHTISDTLAGMGY